MKKITSVIILILLMSSILTHIGGKKSNTPAPDLAASGPLSVTIGGTLYNIRLMLYSMEGPFIPKELAI